MSYRSIKRVLGETSLERKCRFLFGACLLLLITASFWWYGSQTENMVYRQPRTAARLLVDQVLYTKHWESLETNEKFKPVVQDLAKRLNKHEYTSRSIRPYVGEGPKAPAGEFERSLLERFMKLDAKQVAGLDPEQFPWQIDAEKQEYQYYQPIYAEKSCLLCHKTTAGVFDLGDTGVAPGGSASAGVPLSEGDLMAVIQVAIPNGPTQRSLTWNRAVLLSTAIITVFLAMVASYVIVRYVIVKPLRHLREVSDAVSRGNVALRADIHTGDEFEELATAFNRMLRHLVTVQDELRQVNVNLDGKVDELAQVNMRLYEMNTIKSDFLATMSHELRTPLNSILGFSDVLGSIDALSDKQKRYVQNIQKSGRTLLEMINDILDLAKIESGKVEVRLTEFAVEQIVAAQCDMARPLSERKNIDLETQLPTGLPPVRQDQARVQQILNNLLSNAIKFTPEGGRITVSVERDGQDHLLLHVADTGVGIATEDQQTIFEKFRQGRTGAPTGDAMTREYSGSGLGLSIVKELCKLLGGGIAVQSELGRGSTFTVNLPWRLEEQPRLDSTLIEEYDDFTRPRFDVPARQAP
jgi:signal transduction histidine kinase